MEALVRKIVGVPTHIKLWVLTLYLYSCRELSQIAFYQWRLCFPSKIRVEKELLEEMLDFRINYSFGERMIKKFKEPLEKTK